VWSPISVTNFQQINDCFQPALVRHRKRGVDAKTKLGQPDDVGQIEIFEWLVVGNVEEDRLDLFLPRHTYLLVTGRPDASPSRGRLFPRPSSADPVGLADIFSLVGVLMILRTAATRSELRPRIFPICSGVGTGLPMM